MGFSFPNPINGIKNVVHFTEDAGSTVINKTKTVAVATVNATEHAAVKTFNFEADVTKFALQKTFAGAKAVGSTTVDLAGKGVDLTKKGLSAIGSGFDRLTHPGDPNPPAAQGLQFSETKSATNLAYDAKQGETYRFPNGEQWKVVDVSEDKSSGFRAIALQSTDPNDRRTIVAFAGTDPKSGKDWITDAGQGLGFQTKQYGEAVEFAQKWQGKEGDNVILTGHSLGGGLASYAAIKTGLNATALNSAPLAVNHLGGNPLSSAVRHPSNITQYYVPGEILTNIDGLNPLDVRPGNSIAVQGKYSNLNPASVILNHMGGSAATGIPDPELVK